MAPRTKKIDPKSIDVDDDVPLDVTPQATVYVRLEKHSKPYRGLAADQWSKGIVTKQGNIIVDNREFELGRTYQVPATPAIKEAIRLRYLNAGGKFHYIGDTGKTPKKPMLLSKKATEKAEKSKKPVKIVKSFGDLDG
ncbi:MAG: hypothetical protein WC145_10625 [Aliarcobacter sp.]